MLRSHRKTSAISSNSMDDLEVLTPHTDEDVSFAPEKRFFRDVIAFSTTTSTKPPTTHAADGRIFDGELPANNTALSAAAETYDVMNATSSIRPDINDRQADAAALLGFGFSILLYFGLVVCLAYRGRAATKHNLDYCLVQKKVLPHEEAHKFTRDVSIIQNSTRCFCPCKHFSKGYSNQAISAPAQNAPIISENLPRRARVIPKFTFFLRRKNDTARLASTASNTPHVHRSNKMVGISGVSNNLALQNGLNDVEKNANGKGSLQVNGEWDNSSAENDNIANEDQSSRTNKIDGCLREESKWMVDLNKVNDEKPLCPICLCDFEVGESVVWSKLRGISGGCKHVFHRECFVPWAQRGHLRCPVCRDTFWSMNAHRAIRLSQIPNPGEGGNHEVVASSDDTVVTEREVVSDEEGTSQQHQTQTDLMVPTLPLQRVRVEVVTECDEPVRSTQTAMDVVNVASEKQHDAEPWYIAILRKRKPLESIAENSNFCVLCGLVSPGEN